jgi:Tol biopolymer transport system component
MRTHATLTRPLAVLGLTALVVGACNDADAPVAPAVPSAPSLAKGGPNSLPSNGRIYFSSNFTGNLEVYSMNADGSDRRRLTYSADQEGGIDVSRDGKKLVTAGQAAGSGEGLLHSMNADGTNRRLVTSRNNELVASPAWSPDTRTIAYASVDLNNLDGGAIWTVSASGGKATRLTPPAQRASSPAWSPDGARIVYAASPVGLGNADLYTMNADGSAAQLLYDCVEWCMNPVWSRDGTRIFYVAAGAFSHRIEYCTLQPYGAVCGIPLATDVSAFIFALSPDESQLAFRLDEIINNLGSQRVATANVNGSAPSAVTGNLSDVYDVAWSR